MSDLREMKPEHLSIESVPQQKQGGQHVGVISTGVKITHIPTGLTATCSIERSQMRNRNVALAMIEYGLAELEFESE